MVSRTSENRFGSFNNRRLNCPVLKLMKQMSAGQDLTLPEVGEKEDKSLDALSC